MVFKLSRHVLSLDKFRPLKSWTGNVLGGLREGEMFLGDDAGCLAAQLVLMGNCSRDRSEVCSESKEGSNLCQLPFESTVRDAMVT